MSDDNSVSENAAPAQLRIRKGSIAAPLGLLFLTIVLFVVYGLPSGIDQLGASIGLTQSVSEPLTLEAITKAFEVEATRDKLIATVKSYTAWEVIQKIARPLAKVYLDQLVSHFGLITKSLVTTLAQLSLYSLIPGLAGLIYRRNFTLWFLTSFALLLAINSSGAFGSLTSAEPMPGAGAVFFFVVSQVVLLILAYRLRRHAKTMNLIAPRFYNWALTAVLALIGVACWQGWGPGYDSAGQAPAAHQQTGRTGAAVPTPSSASSSPAGSVPTSRNAAEDATASRASREPAATDQDKAEAGRSNQGAAPSAGVNEGVNPAAAVPAAPPKAQQAVMGNDGPTRSWIWWFLGSGLTGWIYKWEFILLGLPLIYTLLRNSAAWTARSPKNIVICLDGTSNTPDQMEMGFLAQTNVFKLFNALKSDQNGMFVPNGQFDASLCKKYGAQQVAFYYAGVGNKYDNDPILQTFGLAAGKGAAEIVERAYLDLVRVYQPGDRIFIFGFSRGAAISRLLARTVDARGAPRSVWTLRLFGKHRTLWTSSRKQPVPIDVLGCWDTVGSFGVAKTIAGINFQQLNLFNDLTVPDNVAQAYHMLALDEQRAEFEPTLMDPDPIRPERIVEVWFAGDHANIGGGWATDKLSDVTLDFILRRISSGYAIDDTTQPGAERWGIHLAALRTHKMDGAPPVAKGGVLAVDPDSLGQVRHWFSNLYTYRPRKLPLHAVISDSVFERMKTSIPVYAPQSLFDLNDALDAKRDLIEAKVGKLTETQSLQEAERNAMLEFKDKLRLNRWSRFWDELTAARAPRPAELILSNAGRGEGAQKA